MTGIASSTAADDEIFSLTGKRALVTGTSRGLGLQMAKALARAGADLVVTSRTLESLKGPCGELKSFGRQVLPLALDLRDEASIRAAADAAGDIDILVNNGGCNIRKPALDVSWDDWDTIVDTNLKGSFFMTQAVVPGMLNRGWGRVIMIGSCTSLFGFPGLGPYTASRGGVRQLTMSLASEFGPQGVTVNCLAPGWFRTAQNDVLYRDADWLESIVSRTPLRRPGRADDLDGAVVFLASEASRFVTGQTLMVDGGFTTGETRALPASQS